MKLIACVLTALLAPAIICLLLGKERKEDMANLSVRKLDDNVYKQLRIRAAQHGVSLEEEARQIISQAVSAPEKISTVFRKYFGHENGIDLETEKHRNPHDPMEFE